MTIVATSISEKALLATVLELGEAYGWMVYHVMDTFPAARVTARGFPDLTMIRPEGGTLLFIELKSEKGRLSPEQKRYRDALSNCEGCHYYLWRPSDLLDGTIEKHMKEGRCSNGTD